MGTCLSDYRDKEEACLCAAEKMRNPAEQTEVVGIVRNCMLFADHELFKYRRLNCYKAHERRGERSASSCGLGGGGHFAQPP
jgi:hypothetical protein